MLRMREVEFFPPLMSHELPFYIYRRLHDKRPLLFMPHWHEYIFEIIYVAKGHARFHIGGKTIHAVEGDIFLIPEGVLHAGEAIDEVPDYYAILFNRHLLTDSGLPGDEIARLCGPTPAYVIKDTDHDLYNHFWHPIRKITKEYDEQEKGYGVAIKASLILLVNELTRHFLTDPMPQRTRQSEERVFNMLRNVTDFVSSNYTRKITLDEISRHVKMSPHYFCYQFKRATGRTLTDYVNMVRIDKAAELILETDLSVTEISAIVGICNPNYFGKLFRKYKHCTPTEFRKKHASPSLSSPFI